MQRAEHVGVRKSEVCAPTYVTHKRPECVPIVVYAGLPPYPRICMWESCPLKYTKPAGETPAGELPFGVYEARRRVPFGEYDAQRSCPLEYTTPTVELPFGIYELPSGVYDAH